jgi:hypothetical protein
MRLLLWGTNIIYQEEAKFPRRVGLALLLRPNIDHSHKSTDTCRTSLTIIHQSWLQMQVGAPSSLNSHLVSSSDPAEWLGYGRVPPGIGARDWRPCPIIQLPRVDLQAALRCIAGGSISRGLPLQVTYRLTERQKTRTARFPSVHIHLLLLTIDRSSWLG